MPINIKVLHPNKEIVLRSDDLVSFPESVKATTPLEWIDNLKKAFNLFKEDVFFEPFYPDWIIDTTSDNHAKDTMTWKIRTMMPKAQGGPASEYFGSTTRDVKPSFERSGIVDKEGNLYTVISQGFDYFFQFDAFSTEARRAEELTYWFRKSFMNTFGRTFGTPQIYFRGIEDSENKENLLKTDMRRRTLVYLVHLNDVTVVPDDVYQLARINIHK